MSKPDPWLLITQLYSCIWSEYQLCVEMWIISIINTSNIKHHQLYHNYLPTQQTSDYNHRNYWIQCIHRLIYLLQYRVLKSRNLDNNKLSNMKVNLNNKVQCIMHYQLDVFWFFASLRYLNILIQQEYSNLIALFASAHNKCSICLLTQ